MLDQSVMHITFFHYCLRVQLKVCLKKSSCCWILPYHLLFSTHLVNCIDFILNFYTNDKCLLLYYQIKVIL